MSASDQSAWLEAPRVDVNTFQKIWAALNTRAAANAHTDAVIAKLVQLDSKGAEKAISQVLESLRLSLSEREAQRSGTDLIGCSLINTATYLLLRHGGSPQLRSKLEPYVKHPAHARFVELMDVWAWQQEGVGAFVRCLAKITCHPGMEAPLLFNSELLDIASSKSLSLILFRRIVQDSSLACTALQHCARELSQPVLDTQKTALLHVVRICLCSLPLLPADILAALLTAVRPLYLYPLPLGKFARDVLRMLGQEEQRPGSLMSFGACSASFACGVDPSEISSISRHFHVHPANLICNPEARLGYYATCFLQENSPPFLSPDLLSLLYLYTSAIAAMSKTLSNAWASKSDVLAQSLIAARDSSLDVSGDVSTIREICLAVMEGHQQNKGLDDVVGFDLEALHSAKLEAATVALATKVSVLTQQQEGQEVLFRASETAEWPDSSNRSTFWCVLCFLTIPPPPSPTHCFTHFLRSSVLRRCVAAWAPVPYSYLPWAADSSDGASLSLAPPQDARFKPSCFVTVLKNILCNQAAASSVVRVVVGGGDGTVNLFVGALAILHALEPDLVAKTSILVYLLPLGRCNRLASFIACYDCWFARQM
jgi:hypothetical protein